LPGDVGGGAGEFEIGGAPAIDPVEIFGIAASINPGGLRWSNPFQ
jgi:hypothetical protein